jgi:hypothetical protein
MTSTVSKKVGISTLVTGIMKLLTPTATGKNLIGSLINYNWIMKIVLNRLQKQNSISVKLAGLSFAVGTLDFLLYIVTGDEYFIGLGLGILVLAFFTNIVLFLIVMANLFIGDVPFKEALLTIYVLLLNIPIAMFYCYVALQFL